MAATGAKGIHGDGQRKLNPSGHLAIQLRDTAVSPVPPPAADEEVFPR